MTKFVSNDCKKVFEYKADINNDGRGIIKEQNKKDTFTRHIHKLLCRCLDDFCKKISQKFNNIANEAQ